MSTSGTPIRFRCFQCEKVLKVSRSRAGQAVTCPGCSTELIVPEPVDEAPANSGVAPSPAPAPAEEDPGQLFRNLLDPKPRPAPAPSAPPPAPIPAPAAARHHEPAAPAAENPLAFLNLAAEPSHAAPAGGFPAIQTESQSPALAGSPFPLISTDSSPPKAAAPKAKTSPKAAPPPPSPVVSPAPAPAPAAEPVPALAALFPALNTEPAAPVAPVVAPPPSSPFPMIQAAPEPIARPQSTARAVAPAVSAAAPVAVADRGGPRRNDIILPRTAVVLWTFMVLVAVVCAFAAGLLLGHFVWIKPGGAA